MQLVLSGPIRRFVQFQDEFTYDAATPRDALGQLVAKYPQLKPVLFDDTGSVRKVHRMFLNSAPLTDFDSKLSANDRVEIITAIAGG